MSSHTDDDELDPREIEDAADETPLSAAAPEIPANAQDLTEWDNPPSSAGTVAAKAPLEDEVAPAEACIEEGLDEADRHQRMAAADPDFEP